MKHMSLTIKNSWNFQPRKKNFQAHQPLRCKQQRRVKRSRNKNKNSHKGSGKSKKENKSKKHEKKDRNKEKIVRINNVDSKQIFAYDIIFEYKNIDYHISHT